MSRIYFISIWLLISSYRFKNILTDTQKWKAFDAKDLWKMEVCSNVLLSTTVIQFAPAHQKTMYLRK